MAVRVQLLFRPLATRVFFWLGGAYFYESSVVVWHCGRETIFLISIANLPTTTQPPGEAEASETGPGLPDFQNPLSHSLVFSVALQDLF